MRLFAILVLWISFAAFPTSLLAEAKNSCEVSGCELAASCNAESNTSSNTLKTLTLAAVIAIVAVFLSRTRKNRWYLVVGGVLSFALLTSLIISKTEINNSPAICKPFNPNDTIGKNIFLPPGDEFISEDGQTIHQQPE